MKRFLLIFTFLSFSFYSSQAQKEIEYYFEFSPHFTRIINLRDYKTHRLSFKASLKMDLKITEKVSFISALSFLTAGAKDDRFGRVETIGVNYMLLTIGSKLRSNKFYILPEFGMAVYLNHIESSVISSSLSLNDETTLSLVSLLNGLTIGYEFQKKKS